MNFCELICIKGWLCFHSVSISFSFKGHSLWGPGQESRNVQSSSYSWNHVQVSTIIYLFIYLLLCPFCRSRQKVIPSPSISFDTLDVMQQSRLSCGPSVTTGRERERELLSFLTLIWCDSTLIWIWQQKWTDCRFQWREIEPIINSQWHSTQVLFFNLWFIYLKKNMFKNQRQCVFCYAYRRCMLTCISPVFLFFPFLAQSQFSVDPTCQQWSASLLASFNHINLNLSYCAAIQRCHWY